MAEDPNPEQPPDWKAIATQFAQGYLTEGVPGLIKAWQTANVETHGQVKALSLNLTEDVASRAGELLHSLEEPFLPVVASFIAPILAGLFGAEFDQSEFARLMARGSGNRGAQAIVAGFMSAVVGDTPAEIQPTDAGAKRIAAAAVQAELETGFNAVAFEALSHMLPFDIGHFEGVKELPEGMIRALGVSRLVRRALQPIVTTCCTTPAAWYMNKLHRPTLLGASALAKQIARNPAQAETWKEDLRREGFSEARIEALLNEQAKFHSVTDLDLLVRANVWSGAAAQKHLQDQGYAPDVAATELLIEKLKRIAAFERQIANAAIDAFVAGRISEGELGGAVTGTTISPQEKAQLTELAIARRMYARRPLTPSEAERCVRADVLTVIDYRRALERDGRDDEAVAALELLLRWELDKDRNLDRAREEQAKSRAAEKAAREAAAALKLRAVEAQRALERRGSEADLEAAAVRGLIPLGRVAEVYAAKYDADTVQILLDALTDRRADYVEQQERAAQARARAAVRRVDVGSVERAVLEHVLTLDQFRARLIDMQFGADDADLLTATLAARLADLEAAQHARDEAAAAAKVKHLDLGRLETLVRRGHRTLHDYDALLDSLGYEDAARAAMVELLQLHIDDDAAAAQLRAAAAAADAARGLSIEQLRRAVVLGIRPIADYTPFLLRQGFTTDAAAVLLAELQFDVDEAAAARARRATADRRSQAGRIPLADLRRAARLGLIDPTVYTARLAAEDYSDDEIAIELDLLTTEIGADRALQASADARAAAAPAPGLSLSQVAAAVVAGAAGIGDYTARALGLGFSTDDAATLTATLQAKLDALAAARARRDALAVENATRELSRADVEKSVRQGLQTLDEYSAWLVTAGYADDDAALLVAELATALDAGGAGGASGG